MFAHVFKFNPNHDKRGRFTFASGAASLDLGAAVGPATKLAFSYRGDPKTDLEVIAEVLSPEQQKLYHELLEDTMLAVRAGKETHKLHATEVDGKRVYSKERTKVHKQVLDKMMEGAAVYAKPEAGKAPELVILGGRGGSGKGQFSMAKSKVAGVYDPSKSLVIDPDRIKELLARKDGHASIGHRAYLYHQESSDISKKLIATARRLGLNVVIDLTLNSDKRALARSFIKKGYTFSAYYMHLPQHKAFARALERAKGRDGKMTGRLVSSDVLKTQTHNETNFDKLIKVASSWKLFSNDVPRGEEPKLIAGGP